MNPPDQMKTDALLDGFIVWLGAGHSKATQQSYYDGLRRFRKWANVHKKPIKEITLTDLSHFILGLEACKLKGATRFSYVTALRSFWRWLHQQGIVSFSEKMIPLPEYEKDMRDHLLPEEFSAMMAIFDEHFPKDLRNKCMLSFLYDTGLRLGEFLSIDIGAIEMDKRQCIVKTFKRKNHKRAVFWGDETNRLLIGWLDLRHAILKQGNMHTQSLWIGISSQYKIGDRLEKSAVQRMFRNVRAKAGITRRVSVHSCRHGLATELIKSGMSTPHVSRILGHANLNSTMIYTHLDHDDLRDAYRKYRIAGA
jgi:site-specific recombinase XerD